MSRKVFVSGCYDILHAGHIQFFEEAKREGDYLIVSFASADVLWTHKERKPSIPDDHKYSLLASLRVVDEVVLSTGGKKGLEFEEYFLRVKPDVLVVTQDDKYKTIKKELCDIVGAEFKILKKTPPKFSPVSSSSIVKWVQAPTESPLRVDFAGGWLDVPRFSREGEFIVNCSISPTVSLRDWDYEKQSGLGGSGAWALLNGKDGVASELDLGVGWQDPAVIKETGLCVWRSGVAPVLDFKMNGDFLNGLMAILWTGQSHDTPEIAHKTRDFNLITDSGRIARSGVFNMDIEEIAQGINLYHDAQLKEGMGPLPFIGGTIANKYCGGGHGGYALYLFRTRQHRDDAVSNNANLRPVEPYIK